MRIVSLARKECDSDLFSLWMDVSDFFLKILLNHFTLVGNSICDRKHKKLHYAIVVNF